MLYLSLFVLQLLNVVLVRVEGPSLLLFKFFKLKLKTLFLSLLHRLSDVRILIDQGLLFTFKFIFKVSLSLTKLVLTVFLQLQLLSFLLLLELLPIYRNLPIDLHLDLGTYLLLFLALVDLPPLLLLFDLRLVGLEDFLLLQLEVLVNLFNRPREVLLQKFSLLLQILVYLSLDERVIVLSRKHQWLATCTGHEIGVGS